MGDYKAFGAFFSWKNFPKKYSVSSIKILYSVDGIFMVNGKLYTSRGVRTVSGRGYGNLPWRQGKALWP